MQKRYKWKYKKNFNNFEEDLKHVITQKLFKIVAFVVFKAKNSIKKLYAMVELIAK